MWDPAGCTSPPSSCFFLPSSWSPGGPVKFNLVRVSFGFGGRGSYGCRVFIVSVFGVVCGGVALFFSWFVVWCENFSGIFV